MSRQVIRPATREHLAACHVLTDPLIWGRVARFVAPDGGVDWLELHEHVGYLSSGQQLLVDVAQDLYSAGGGAKLGRLCGTLGTPHLCRVLEAIALLRPDVAADQGGVVDTGGIRTRAELPNPERSEGWPA